MVAVLGCGTGDSSRSDARPLLVFCAAGMKEPVTAIAEAYRRDTGVEVQLQFGGTGSLMSQIAIAKQGDLFIAADAEAVAIVRSRELVTDVVPIARQYPVVAVKAGNPKAIRTLDDLLRDDVRVAIGNPEAASIGKATKAAFGDRWPTLRERLAVMKPTVTEVALDVSIGSVDAGVVWNAVVPMFDGLETVRVAELEEQSENASVCVLAASEQPAAALDLARFVVAPNKGARTFAERGFDVLAGDPWEGTGTP